jgi:hypothetical protein
VACSWLFLESRTLPERFCDKPGRPYCPEHQREMDAMEKSDKDWEEILATHRAVCEEQQEEQTLCAVCNRRPVRTDYVYCEECCADEPLGILGAQG